MRLNECKVLYRFAVVWTALVTVIPAIFGVIMLVNHSAVTTPGATATDVFGVVPASAEIEVAVPIAPIGRSGLLLV